MKTLVDELLNQGLITEEQLEEARIKQIGAKKPLQDLLVEMGYVNEGDIVRIMSNIFNMPIAKLDNEAIDTSVVNLLPYEKAKRYGIFPIRKEGNTLFVAMSDPVDVVAIDEIKSAVNMDVEPLLAAKSDISVNIEKYYNSHDVLYDLFKNITGVDKNNPLKGKINKEFALEDNPTSGEFGPVTRVMNFLLSDAVGARASDIHIEPQEDIVRIRYRVDGDLREIINLPKKLLSPIVARIKIMSKLNVAENRIPQDGRASVFTHGRKIDIRVSVLPTYYGEKVVLRILDSKQAKINIDELGFNNEDLVYIKEVFRKPQGMILVTGPTGSGKTSTLYGALNFIKDEAKNIVTIEDPIEYLIEGITQIQLNPVKNLTFATGLRSILRQDPNVIFVGEIRDAETAEIAFRSSLTGHLVLSSLHTTSSVASITRLLDIGLEPYLISSSLIVIIAQRLVKRICPYCKEEYTLADDIKNKFRTHIERLSITKFYKGKGCQKCLFTGFLGRVGIFEILKVEEGIKSMISAKAHEEDILKEGRKKGLKLLMDTAFEKVAEGITTIEEVANIVDFSQGEVPPRELKTEKRERVKIIIADDEEHIRKVLEMRFKSAGYDIVKASNGKEAVELALREKPDLIIMDIMMPQMDGFEATKILKSRLETAVIPIMMLTAKKDVDSELKGIDMGADDYMTKPFDGQRLLARVKMLLRRK